MWKTQKTQKQAPAASDGIITAKDLEYAEAHKQERRQEMRQSWEKAVRNEQQDAQVRQSKTSRRKRENVITHGVRQFFGKGEKAVVEDMQVTSQREAIRTRERQSEENFVEQLQAEQDEQAYMQLTSGTLQVTPDTESTSPSGLPAERIDATEEGVALLEEHQKEPGKYVVEAGKYRDEPLFPRMPDMQDVEQGSVGDCFFLAAVSSIVQNDPQQMRGMMKDNGDNTATVRFYRERTKSGYFLEQDRKKMDATQKRIDEGGKDAYHSMAPAERLEFLIQKIRWDKHSKSSLHGNLGTLPVQIFQRKYWNDVAKKEMGFFELLMDKDFVRKMTQDTTDPFHANYPPLAEFRWIAMEQGEMQNSLKKLETLEKSKPEATDAFLCFMQHFMEQSKKDTGVDFGSEGRESFTQEIYVTVTKDLPEEVLERDRQGNVVKSRAVYASGPLWLRVLEKAYAASGMNQVGKIKSKNSYDLEDSNNAVLGRLDRGYTGIVGGSISQAIQHLTGHKSSSEGLLSVKEDENNLTHALQAHFGDHWQDEVKIKFHLSDADMEKLAEALQEEDERLRKSYTEKDKTGKKVTKYYREQAAGLDDLIRVILESKVKSSVQDPEEERRQLAQQLTDVLAQSDKSQLQYARFSGEYTKKATETLEKIKNALAQNKLLGAGSASFVPESVSSGGLNGEAISGGIVENHAYSILGMETRKGNEFIVMRNPWAAGQNEYHMAEDGTVMDELDRSREDNGVFLVDLNDFMRKFDVLYGV
ncbi:MAG: C2 family cysteine protease [Lachnospiraceae bacterium]|nr:C2 family cysteine protease [Lachnospiraceae bacterium]